MEVFGTACSGELDMIRIKRKSSQHAGDLPRPDSCLLAATAAGPVPPLGPRPQQRASCGPTCSSPAVGGWGIHSSSGGGASCADMEMELDSCDAAESARGKALRICSNPAGPVAALAGCMDGAGSAAAAAAAAVAQLDPLGAGAFEGGGEQGCEGCLRRQASGAASIPSAGNRVPQQQPMFHSYHVGCCSRISSGSSLCELAGAAPSTVAPADAAAQSAAGALTAAAAAAAVAGASTGGLGSSGLSCSCDDWCWPQPGPMCGSCGQLAAEPLSRQQQPAQQQAQQQGQQHEQVASFWADLPDDILKRVLERLQPSTLRVLRLVCRGWESAASRLLRHLRPETVVGKQLGRRFPSLHSLDLSNCLMGVDFATPRMLRLQSLLTDEHLGELAGLTRLQQLSLRGASRLSGSGLSRLSHLPSLSMLNLSNCTGITDEGLAALVAAAPQLDTLNLQGCSRVGDGGIAHLAALPALRHILLPAGVTDASMAVLASMPALERVALRSCNRVTTCGVSVLLQRRSLKRVVITQCPQVTLETLCEETSLKVITVFGSQVAAPTSAGAGGEPLFGAAAGAGPAPAGMVSQDMHLLVAAA